MAERFRQIVDRIVEKWKSWSAKQKTIIISTAAVILVAVAIIAFAVTRPNYEVLTTCQDYTELGSVTSILNENGYKYQVQDNTLVVKVEKKNLTNAKMAIASADIKSDGYTFDDAMKSSLQQLNLIRQNSLHIILKQNLYRTLNLWMESNLHLYQLIYLIQAVHFMQQPQKNLSVLLLIRIRQ